MPGAIKLLLHTPSWRGALLSTELTLLFNYSYNISAQIFNDLSKILIMFILAVHVIIVNGNVIYIYTL
jgi:hypothetical protein